MTGYAIGLALKTLPNPDVAAAYEKAGGFCAPHFLKAASQSTPEQSRTPLEVLEDRLSRAGADLESVSMLTGTDTDSATRVWFFSSLPEDPCDTPEGKNFGALERLKEAFSHDCCLACLCAGRARRRYLRWIGQERAKNRSDRKLDWLVRYEGRGREQSAWSRAMGQIDGEVFLGGELTAATP